MPSFQKIEPIGIPCNGKRNAILRFVLMQAVFQPLLCFAVILYDHNAHPSSLLSQNPSRYHCNIDAARIPFDRLLKVPVVF